MTPALMRNAKGVMVSVVAPLKSYRARIFILETRLELDQKPFGVIGDIIELSPWPPPPYLESATTYQPKPVPIPAETHVASCSISTRFRATLRLASKWMKECETSHKKCKGSNLSAAAMPTRLVDVGHAGQQSDPHIVTTTESDVHGQYLALSYCWGGYDGVKLTTSTLNALSSGIPLQTLPKNHSRRHICY